MQGPNTVELLGTYGGDVTIALSAWTSTHRDLTPERRESIPRLLRDVLMGLDDPMHGPPHTSPFEKGILHFLVTTDIATHIHMLKHRVAVSINAESARYKELRDDKFYVPEDWPEDLADMLARDIEYANERYHFYVRDLERRGFRRSRAKESARYVRPYASQLTADVMFHFNSFVHFLDLRLDSHAQLEVRMIASKMLELVRETGKFDAALDACGYGLTPRRDAVTLTLDRVGSAARFLAGDQETISIEQLDRIIAGLRAGEQVPGKP